MNPVQFGIQLPAASSQALIPTWKKIPSLKFSSPAQDGVRFSGRVGAARVLAGTLAVSDVGIDVALIAMQLPNIMHGNIEADTLVHMAGVLNGILGPAAAVLVGYAGIKQQNELVFEDMELHRRRFVISKASFLRKPKIWTISAKNAKELKREGEKLVQDMGYQFEISKDGKVKFKPFGSVQQKEKYARKAWEIIERTLQMGDKAYSSHPLTLAFQM